MNRITTKRGGRRLRDQEVAQLVRAARAGDRDAWDELVLAFGGMIRSVARAHRLGDAAAADVAQTTWLLLLEHLDDLIEPSRVGPWLATTARRECLRVLRDAQRLRPCSDDLPEQRSPEAAPDSELLRAERDEALWRSFARLRPRDQSLLRLLMVDRRRSYEEISAALNMPIGSIGPTRERALARLRHALRRDGALSLLAS
jgi:RNA polymerase sigma factor (sigma-70 family)